MEATRALAQAPAPAHTRKDSSEKPARRGGDACLSAAAAASSLGSTPDSTAVGPIRGAARRIQAGQAQAALGFGSCVTWFVLQETMLSLNNVALFNHSLYVCIGQMAAYLALACAGAARDLRPHAALIRATGIAGAASLPLQLAQHPALAIVGALLMGASSGVLLASWTMRLRRLGTRRTFAVVLGSFLVGVLVSWGCFYAQSALPSLEYVLGVALPLATAFAPWKEEARRTRRRLDARISLPWPFLLVLGATCLLGSFFQGVATNPYAFQSDAVAFFRFAWAAGALAVLLAVTSRIRRPKIQMFFLAALVMLVAGLFLFSAGVLGSIIMPLGMILAARTCCFAFALIALAVLARTSGLPPALMVAAGLALCDGTLGKAAGLMVSGYLQPSFPDLALAASAGIVVFTLLYAISASVVSGANDALDADAEPPVLSAEELAARAETRMAEFGLTPKERETARLILQGLAYAEIAERMGTKERTVKFHASNVFKKASVANRNEFAALMMEPGADGWQDR